MSDPENLKTRGNQSLKTGEFSEAIHYYTQAIELDDNNAVYFSNRAAAYLHMKQYDKALDDANRAITIDSDYIRSYGRKGDALYYLGRYNDAVHAYEAGLTVKPDENTLQSKLNEAKAAINRGSPPPAAGGASGPATTPAAFLFGGKTQIVQTMLAFVRAGIFLSILIYLLTPLQFGSRFFTLAVLSCGLLNARHVLQECGFPQFNKEYVQRIATTHSFYLAIMSPVYLTGSPILLVLFPLGVFEMVHLAVWSYQLAKTINGALAERLYQYGMKLVGYILSDPNASRLAPQTLQSQLTSSLLHYSAVSQILIGIFLLITVFTPARNLMGLVFTWQLLQIQYVALPHTKRAFHTVDAHILTLLRHRYCPAIVLLGYEKLRGYLGQMVVPPDPNAASTGGAGGGISQMARNCSIM
eukprot:gb/GECG01014374.1/.p1 GENE.gb/GECG01014374.1/~~gb/GECG01014374.1/.p1  ORF type:complete len:413 (+),score=30.12 gb/GECG01014374.1/:1-1239(+)